MTPAKLNKKDRLTTATPILLLRSRSWRGRLFALFSFCDELLIALVVQMRHGNPRVRHLVGGTAADTHPLIRIGVLFVRGGVVVIAGDYQDSALRHQWRSVVFIDVARMP